MIKDIEILKQELFKRDLLEGQDSSKCLSKLDDPTVLYYLLELNLPILNINSVIEFVNFFFKDKSDEKKNALIYGMNLRLPIQRTFTWIDKYNDRDFWMLILALKYDTALELITSQPFNHHQIREIIGGFENGVNVSVYAKKEFNEDQMYEIRICMALKLDPTSLLDPKISSSRMCKMRNDLKA